jgi:hypothetical protein
LSVVREVLVKSQEQILKEIHMAGTSGGTGRAPNYAQVLVPVSQAIAIVDALLEPQEDHMAKMRRLAAEKRATSKSE